LLPEQTNAKLIETKIEIIDRDMISLALATDNSAHNNDEANASITVNNQVEILSD